MKEFLKDYGPAISPVLAFFFSIFVIYLKDWFDNRSEKRSVALQFVKLSALIRISAPPRSYHPQKSSQHICVGEARSMTNIARFYNKLLGISPVIMHLEPSVYKYGNEDQIRVFTNIRWWFNITLKQVEEVREERKIENNNFSDIQANYESLIEVLDDPDHFQDYIELPNK